MRTLIVILTISLFTFAQKQNITLHTPEALPAGKELFTKFCGACHSRHSLKVMGPAFETVKSEGKVELLYNFLQNKKTAETFGKINLLLSHFGLYSKNVSSGNQVFFIMTMLSLFIVVQPSTIAGARKIDLIFSRFRWKKCSYKLRIIALIF